MQQQKRACVSPLTGSVTRKNVQGAADILNTLK